MLINKEMQNHCLSHLLYADIFWDDEIYKTKEKTIYKLACIYHTGATGGKQTNNVVF